MDKEYYRYYCNDCEIATHVCVGNIKILRLFYAVRSMIKDNVFDDVMYFGLHDKFLNIELSNFIDNHLGCDVDIVDSEFWHYEIVFVV